jgi:hypothetical protein
MNQGRDEGGKDGRKEGYLEELQLVCGDGMFVRCSAVVVVVCGRRRARRVPVVVVPVLPPGF